VSRGPGGEQYFIRHPRTASRRSTIELALPDVHLALTVDRGVFSPAQVDAGTKYLLLEAPRPDANATNVLDLGCGYGPIAITLALRAVDATVWAVDVNERALGLCRENALAAGTPNVTVVRPDEVPDDIALDAIYSNPPIRIGKHQLHALLTGWLDRLAAGGHAYVVVQRHLGSDSLARWLDANGWHVARLGSRGGYRLLDITR
jgi:16S rRNA (guanine1207-N2)-methyltransferase